VLCVTGAIFAVGLIESFSGGPLASLVLYVTASIALIAVALAAPLAAIQQVDLICEAPGYCASGGAMAGRSPPLRLAAHGCRGKFTRRGDVYP
jgi:hypothetical protein